MTEEKKKLLWMQSSVSTSHWVLGKAQIPEDFRAKFSSRASEGLNSSRP